jgi:peptidoglycan/xylan/chitin deacetylase (PgdA/CDA1 family)
MDILLRLTTPVDYRQNKPGKYSGEDVAVTFDDGLQSFKENALPELVKRKIPVAVVYPEPMVWQTTERL